MGRIIPTSLLLAPLLIFRPSYGHAIHFLLPWVIFSIVAVRSKYISRQSIHYNRIFVSLNTSQWRVRSSTINPSIYNIIRWFAGTPGQKTHQPSVWCSKHYFFSLFLIDLWHSKLFISIIKKIENKLKQFLERILQEIVGKNNTWNIRRLVNESFVQESQRTSVL